MGGSSKTTSASTVPAWVSQAQQDALARAQSASRIGNVGYYGPDVAAMTPSQTAAMQGTNMAASAFGQPTVDVTAGMPTATNYGGMNAYSSGAGYDAALAELKARFPGQFDAIMAQFVNPVTGAMPAGYSQTQMGMPVQTPASPVLDRSSGGYTGGGGGSMSELSSYLPSGVNTSNPSSLLNTIIGKALNAVSPQGNPTAANRPAARPASVTTKPVASKPKTASKPGYTRF